MEERDLLIEILQRVTKLETKWDEHVKRYDEDTADLKRDICEQKVRIDPLEKGVKKLLFYASICGFVAGWLSKFVFQWIGKHM